MYGDYKLLVELSHDAHWFWNPSEDAHGTTSNNVAMSKSESWKEHIKDYPDAAQWTYAKTIPQLMANASLRRPPLDVSVW